MNKPPMKRMTRTLLSSMCALALGLGLAACEDKGQGDEDKAGSDEGEKVDDGKAATEVPADAAVHWIMPKEGSKVPTKFPAAFGVTNMTLTKAGEAVDDKAKGHHHIIIDGEPVPEGKVVPKDKSHMHFGDASANTTLELEPGKHTLTLQLADGAHRSFGEKLSKTINIEVVELDKEPKAFFVEPKDGAKVKSPVKLKFGLEGYAVKAAMKDPIDQTSGHHHIVIDGEAIPTGQVVPKDDKNIHYGDGSTEVELELPKGKHTLTMQLADGAHLSYGPSLSETITVEVE